MTQAANDTDPLRLDEPMIAAVVDRFYARCRADDVVGPVFNSAIDDWDEHLGKIAAFWSSVMLRSGRYHGRPMPAHLKHKDVITPAMFDRWLELWRQTTSELLPPAVASAMQARAGMIAESFKLALFYRIPEGA
ncbi:MAG: preprotein translocase subunit TatC [Caulobacterales bacterium 68-7]|mgnify:CR=1 FL=1|nr:MAG: preprotein translocase subunit TatC [Caulobacterales bacterium 68-7]